MRGLGELVMSEANKETIRVLLHGAAGEIQLAAAEAAAATSVRQGSTAHFVVFYDQGLGPDGPNLADAVLATCEADYNYLQGWFGNIPIGGLPFNVYIQPGANGASHADCAATALYCDAFNKTDPDLVRSLVVAEADEVFMANQGAGWNCGGSNGEALSRILSAAIYPQELNSFATASKWLKSDRSDWVDSTEGTDRHSESIGCGTLFINWLRFQLGYGLGQIVQAGGATLGATYQKLTGRQDGYARFSNLIAEHYPPGSSGDLTNDNPFPLTQQWNSKMRLAVRRGGQIIYQGHFGDGIGIPVLYGNGNDEDNWNRRDGRDKLAVGDWTHDGRDKFAVRRGGQIIYQGHFGDGIGIPVLYGNGNDEDQYLVGDWTGDGRDKFAVRRGSQIIYQEHFGDGIGIPITYGHGNAEDQYLVGDWNGDGKDKLAVRRGSQIIYQEHFGDGIGIPVTYGNGNAEDQYLVGDWNGDGKDKLAVRRGSFIIYQEDINDGIGVPLLYGNGNAEDQYLVGSF